MIWKHVNSAKSNCINADSAKTQGTVNESILLFLK